MITLAHQPLGRTGSGSDVSIISANIQSNTSMVLREQIVRENSLQILGLAPASTRYGVGIFCLYSIQDECHLMVLTSEMDTTTGEIYDREALLKCPQGMENEPIVSYDKANKPLDASSLTAFSDGDGYSSLLVGCPRGLVYFDSKKAADGGKEGTLIFDVPLFQDCKQLAVAQDHDTLSVWATNSSDELGYICTSRSDLRKGSPTLLLPAGHASAFAPLVQRATPGVASVLLQTLVVNDSRGNLCLMQQGHDTGVWHNEPFFVANNHEVYEMPTYTTHLIINDAQKAPMKNAKAFITSSAMTQVTCNGRRVALQPSGMWLNADDSGEITVISPTNDLGTQQMTITRIRDSNGHEIDFKPMIVDPSRKVLDRLSHIDANFDFTKATTQSGKKLFEEGNTPDQETMKTAARCFSQLNAAYKFLPSNGTSIATAEGALMIKSLTLITRTALETVGDIFWEAWHYVERRVKDVRDWIVEKVGEFNSPPSSSISLRL